MLKRVNLRETAKTIYATNQYMTVGTVCRDNTAWVAPVAYAFDKNYNLYFISMPDAKHSQNIAKNADISLTIFDSRQLFGEGVGLQIKGEAHVVPALNTINASRCYFGRHWPYGNVTSAADFKKFFTVYKYRFYKVTPLEVWLNDPRLDYDKRVKVKL